jgi:hypothetical protein
LHARQERVQHHLADPGLYTADTKERLKALMLEKGDLDSRCAALEHQWLEACEQLEGVQGGQESG